MPPAGSMGCGLGIHKALDQIGAFAGPLLVAAIIAAAGRIWPALAVLAVPGAASILILVAVRARGGTEPRSTATGTPTASRATDADPAVPLPRRFWWFAVAAGLCTAGRVTMA